MTRTALALTFSLAACGPDPRPACDEVHAAMRSAHDAAAAEDYEAFLEAYAQAVPLFAPVRDALYDADAQELEGIEYPMAAAGDAWMLNHSVVGLLASRAAGNPRSVDLFEGFISASLPGLDSTLTATAHECEAL